MFEKEIKFIIDYTLNRIKKLGTFFTFENLASSEIHPAIILYISNKLEFLIYEDRKNLLQNSSFDYSGSEIAGYFNLIGEEIKKNKRLALEDVKTLVSLAVTFNINYLVKPNQTLIKLIFDENKTRNVNEIKMMLNYLYYYDYARNVFLGYFSKRKIISLSETEFGLILSKIDHQMFSEHTRDLIDNALVSIGDFFNEGGLNKTRISAQTIETFLKEKNLMEALFKLRRSIPAEDRSKYNIDEIRKILYSKETVKVKQESEEEKTSEEINMGVKETEESLLIEPETDYKNKTAEDEVIPDALKIESEKEIIKEKEETTDEDRNILHKNIPEEEKALDNKSPDDFLSRYESELKSLEELEAQLNNLDKEDLSSEDLNKENEKKDNIERPDNKETLTFEEIMSSTEQEETTDNKEEDSSDEIIFEEEEVDLNLGIKKEIPSAHTERKKNDILNFLTDKEMEKIVSNVFNEDEEDFVNTMEKISDSATYEQATDILKAVFSSYKVSPYSKDAVSLTNAVSNFFYQD